MAAYDILPCCFYYTLWLVPKEVWNNCGAARVSWQLGFEATLRLKRQEFGVSWNKTMDSGGLIVSDTVDIELVGEAIKEG
jgi:polyisoprenoid-binding protein YceI